MASHASSPPSAEAITRASRSNLALAFIALPKERREAITTFYAFCRIIDDIADDPGIPLEERERQLNDWKKAVCVPFEGEPTLAATVRELIAAWRLRENWFIEIINGCEMDLRHEPYPNFEALRLYCYRVASVVGLVSIEIFGYQNEATRRYAVDLGYALQLTNIIRDVAKDLANDGRIYLPADELERFGITRDDLLHRKGGPRFVEMMAFQAERAEHFYRKAVGQLPPEDRHSMIAAEIMRNVYHRLLGKIRRDRFRVFDRFHRLGKLEKIAIVLLVRMGVL
ncbi:MAG TPA: squalene/phytoene synthase family protein [Chthoniobacteraceae bacterium]|nr:squalene/phytoene synthase family protein [Chthoniobacteraceae bacterium]